MGFLISLTRGLHLHVSLLIKISWGRKGRGVQLSRESSQVLMPAVFAWVPLASCLTWKRDPRSRAVERGKIVVGRLPANSRHWMSM